MAINVSVQYKAVSYEEILSRIIWVGGVKKIP